MTKKQRQSSRKRMAASVRNVSKQQPNSYVRLNEQMEETTLYNRAMRKKLIHFSKAQKGLSAVQESKKHRKRILVKARRVIRAIRKETKKLMRLAGGQ